MLALVREVSPALGRCELTHLERLPIDPARAADQHRDYTRALQTLGCTLEWLPALPEYPDSVFIEDTAVVLDAIAVVTRPGASSRRGETPSVAAALERHRRVVHIAAPGSLDGGDVLHVDRTLYVGTSARTNAQGIAELERLLQPHGQRVRATALQGCLHLKSAVSFIPPDTVLLNPAWVDPTVFAGLRVVAVDEREPYAANTLTIGGTTLISAAYPRTRQRVEAAGVRTQALDVGELHKAEGALTCMSLLLE
ncbi:MAG: dimethylargininase [Gammaproteobacteria bacterium]|nr:dimethylargininase [Gammaproteobacteria bacterium]MBV9725536.1 dimethylargininase [Gammaproteobacteria bacterium]